MIQGDHAENDENYAAFRDIRLPPDFPNSTTMDIRHVLDRVAGVGTMMLSFCQSGLETGPVQSGQICQMSEGSALPKSS